MVIQFKPNNFINYRFALFIKIGIYFVLAL